MQGIVDFILSDAGLFVVIILAILLLIFVTNGVLISKGYISTTTTTSPGRVARISTWVLGEQHSILYVISGAVILLAGVGGLALWNQITTTAPYVPDATYNFVFVSMVIVLLVSMATLAILMMRFLGQLETHKELTWRAVI